MRGRVGIGSILLLIFAGCGGSSDPAEPWAAYRVSASMSTNSVFIGEPVELRITADHPPGTTVQLPRLDESPSPLIVQHQDTTVEQFDEEQSRTTISYRIATLEVGDHLVSSNQVVFLRNNEAVHSNLFPFASLQVQSVLTNDQVYAGDKELAEWAPGIPRLLIAIAAVAVLAFAVAGLVAWWITHRRVRIAPAPRLPPAHITALKAIEELKQKKYIENEDRESFHVELSGIVRRYIEQRFGVHAPDQTTEEFLATAGDSRLLESAHQLLTRRFLEQCDLVKFARAHPGAEDMQATLELSLQLINETRISDKAVAV